MSQSTSLTPSSTTRTALSGGLVTLFSLATALSVGSQYYNQPLLGLIANEFHVGADASLVATTTQLGYAAGLILLVPLGDRMDRRTLVLLQCLGLAISMGIAGQSSSLQMLEWLSIPIGMFATIAQQIIPFAAELSPTQQRTKVLSVITSALLVGVLLARTLSGFVGEAFGWRSMFSLGAVIALVMLIALAMRLPRSTPATNESYIKLLGSVFGLLRGQPALMRATLTQSLIFFGFSAFWTILTLLLQTSAFGLSSSAAGLFGLVALIGVALAPSIVRIASSGNPQRATRLGAALVAVSFFLMMGLVNLIGLGIGTVVMITGLQVALISNQTRILEIGGAARGRFNTVFMASQFAFGAAGSAAASLAWKAAGWHAVLALAAFTSILALCVQFKRQP